MGTNPNRHLTAKNVSDREIRPGFLSLAKRVLPERPIICDIGSRDAREGISLLKELNGRELHVFEPNPNAAAVCRLNLTRLNEITRWNTVIFNEAAVSGEAGQVRFYPVNPSLSENKDVGFSSLYKINPQYTRRRGRVVQDEVIVKAIILDKYFAGKPGPDLLWINVEGAELEVLRGARSILNGVTLIHAEVSFRPMQIGKPLFGEIEEYLRKFDIYFHSFIEVSSLKGFLYRRWLLPNRPWRLNAIFCKRNHTLESNTEV